MSSKSFLSLLILLLFSSFAKAQEKLDAFEIARKGTIENAKEILKSNPNAFNVVNEEGYSPLILACYKGNNDVAKFLVENGCEVNGNSKMGTALMAAIVKKNNEIVKLLIEHKANINAFDDNRTTALIYSVQFNNVEAVKLLISSNVDKKHKDKEGKTAFEYAVFSGNEQIINLLK